MNKKNITDIKISKKKKTFPISEDFENYLHKYNRTYKMPLEYEDLERTEELYPIVDDSGNDTLWCTALYSQFDMEEIHKGLIEIYLVLKSDGNLEAEHHLNVDSVDCCVFGNSKPFRIKIRNVLNDNHDYFYIKKADASRVYGLELEHLLSPNYIVFLVYKDTLVEDHISGIPGDMYLDKYNDPNQDLIRLSKEFVKFNERCFLRLLGDQRSYNFLVELTPDFDKMQYRIRSIDFDQQSYEGNIKMYQPQFFKENYPYVEMVESLLHRSSIEQYKIEERSLMAKRILVEQYRLIKLMDVMKKEPLSLQFKIDELKLALYEEVKDRDFKLCNTMGEILEVGLKFVLRNYKTGYYQ
ncbi:MAG: hypothetical protein ACK5MD_07410 [Flavobacteriales bacterium]